MTFFDYLDNKLVRQPRKDRINPKVKATAKSLDIFLDLF